ncbi:MAG TPA: glycosyltransferase family 4 protein [Rhodocyclaceae bacterium]|nr:glycosyltransferase family 4 protein [Rhodocyclaceae bacterium]
MKILHVFHHSNLLNGVDRTTLTLMRALARQGAEVRALVPQRGSVTDALEADGIAFRVADLPCCTSPAPMAELRFFARAASRAKEIATWLDEDRVDLVHLNTGHLIDGAIGAALTGTPAIWHIHAPFEVDYARYARTMSPGGYAWLLGDLGSHVLAVSDDVRTSLLAHLEADRVSTLYNGIDVAELERRAEAEPSDLRSELGLAANAPLVLGVGRISAQKDFAAFVRVAKETVDRHAEVCFAIIGPPEDPALAAALRDMITELRLERRVFVLGPRDDVPQLLDQAQIFLSTAVFEGQGLAALEAMALRKPVVAMACVGLRECIVHDHDGMLVPPADERAAASTLIELLASPARAQPLGENARRAVLERFSADTYARAFLSIAEHVSGPVPIARRGAAEYSLGLLGSAVNAFERLSSTTVPARSLPDRLREKLRELL